MSQPTTSPPNLLSTIARAWHWASGPINLTMLAWVFYGRAVVGAPIGWMSLVMLVVGLPLLVVPMLWLTYRGYSSRGLSQSVTPTQALLYLALWFAMFVCGASIVDFGDSGRGGSVLTRVFGSDLIDQSQFLAVLTAGSTLLLMLGLGVALRLQRDREPEPSPVVASSPPGRAGMPTERVIPGYVPRALQGAGRHPRRTAWMYRHMGWLSAIAFVSNLPIVLGSPYPHALYVLFGLFVVLSGYRHRRSQHRLTLTQYRLVVTVLASVICHGITPYLWRWPAMLFMTLGGSAIAVVCAAFALTVAYRTDRDLPADRLPQDRPPGAGPPLASAAEWVLPEHQRP